MTTKTALQKISANMREKAGKGDARETRRQGRIPAVIYGGKEKPTMISLEARAFVPFTQKAGFFNHLVEIDAGGKTVRALPRDIQFDPVTDQPVHVDFLRVTQGSRVRVYIPVAFINQDKSPGLKRGGALNVVQHQIYISCSADHIPEKVEVNLDGLQIGDTIHIDAIQLPDDAKPVMSGKTDTTIASIAAPTSVKEEAAPAAAAAAATPAAGAAAPAAGAASAAAAPTAKAAEKKK
jgi:large subunit ribosomal protein L25